MIVADVKYEPNDYVRASRFMSRRQNTAFSLLLIFGGICFALVSFTRLSNGDAEWWMVLLVPGLLVFFYLLARALQVRNIGKQFKNAPDAQTVQHWTINADGLTTHSELSSSEIKWDAVIKFRESKTDFFFFTAPRFAKFIPKRAVGEEAQKDLRRLAAENIRTNRS